MSKTKEELASALKKVVCRKPFSKVTIADITRELGMSRENFYYHFHDKYELLKWQCKHDLIDKLAANCALTSENELCNLLISYIESDYTYYHCLVRDLNHESIKKFLYPYLRSIISVYVDRSIDPSVWKMRTEKENFITDFFTEAFFNFFMDYLTRHESMDTSVLKQNFLFLFQEFLAA